MTTSSGVTMTPTQVDRLRRELEFVTNHPERWDQGVWVRPPDEALTEAEPGVDWSCGSTACLAGWTALHADYRPTVCGCLLPPDVSPNTPPHDLPVDLSAHAVARDLLGLTDRQASWLFDGNNNLRDLWEYASAFTDGAIVVPDAVRDAEEPETYRPDYRDHYRDSVATHDWD